MKLFLVRHGSTLANEQQRYAGQLDVPLSSLGEEQVAQTALQLAATSVDAIITSPLQRASATTNAIARYHTVPIYEDNALQELSYGSWEGMTQAEVKERDSALLKLWKRVPTQCHIPGAETLLQLHIRVIHALQFWYVRYPRTSIMWVTHTGVIRVVLCHLNHVDLDQWRLFHPENASVTPVTVLSDDTSQESN